METAQSSFISSERDGIMLSLMRWFVFLTTFIFNANLILAVIFAGILSAPAINIQVKTQMPSYITSINTSSEKIKEQNEIIEWQEAMNVKYAKYKVTNVAKGVIHAKGLYSVNNRSVRVNILEINTKANKNLEVIPKAASSYLNSKATIKNLAKDSIAAINGGYFKPSTGAPLGALIIDNELLTGPIYDRVGFSINNDGTYSMGKTDFKFFLKNHKINFQADNINQPRMLSTHTVIYTDKWGKTSPKPPKYGVNVLIQQGSVRGFYYNSIAIPKGGFVVSGPYKKLVGLQGAKNLKLSIVRPKHFERALHLISAGPYLVKNGEIYINYKEEKLNAITGKNPRTLVGFTDKNELILATVDGREKYSLGMDLSEAARFMKNLGCYMAMNLDGGSSSVMYVMGQITNTTPVYGGIPIADAITVNLNREVAQNDF